MGQQHFKKSKSSYVDIFHLTLLNLSWHFKPVVPNGTKGSSRLLHKHLEVGVDSKDEES